MARPLIIIADHNPFVRRSVRDILTGKDVKVREALSGSEMLQIARNTHPQVIVMESNLPGPGGRSALKAIKGEDGLRNIPVILLREQSPEDESGLDNSDDGLQDPGLEERVFGVVDKPFRQKVLLERIEKALNHVYGREVSEENKRGDQALEGALNSSRIKGLIQMSEEASRGAASKYGEFSDADFNRYQDFLLRKVGLFFDIKRKADLAKALRNRMSALEIFSYLDYYQYLSSSLNEEKELRNLVLYLTIGETTYFRSPDQFKALREYILPRLIPQRRKSGRPSLKIWSAGCSTGEEPYSIAITLREMLPDVDNWDIQLNATDINQKFLGFADEGIYHPRKVRFVNESILHRYFKKEGGLYRIVPEIKRMVKFSFHNLSVDAYTPFDASDIILCRNVLIYFRRDKIKGVIDRFNKVLKDDGFLILGYSETLFQVSEDFKSIHYGDAFFYVKADEMDKATYRQVEEPGIPAIEIPDWTEEYKNYSQPIERPVSTETPAEKSDRKALWHEMKSALLESAPAEVRDNPTPAPVTESIEKSQMETPPAAKLEWEEKIDRIWEEGLNHYFFERFEEAEKSFRNLAEIKPDCARAQLGLGFIHANKGKDEPAMKKIEKALEMNKILPEAYYLRALIEEKNGDMVSAMADYRNVILLDPDFAMAHFNLGILYMKQNRIRDSKREFRNTLKVLKNFDEGMSIKFSGGLHREALIQLCEELSE